VRRLKPVKTGNHKHVTAMLMLLLDTSSYLGILDDKVEQVVCQNISLSVIMYCRHTSTVTTKLLLQIRMP